jgi:hypothetical protein
MKSLLFTFCLLFLITEGFSQVTGNARVGYSYLKGIDFIDFDGYLDNGYDFSLNSISVFGTLSTKKLLKFTISYNKSILDNSDIEVLNSEGMDGPPKEFVKRVYSVPGSGWEPTVREPRYLNSNASASLNMHSMSILVGHELKSPGEIFGLEFGVGVGLDLYYYQVVPRSSWPNYIWYYDDGDYDYYRHKSDMDFNLDSEKHLEITPIVPIYVSLPIIVDRVILEPRFSYNLGKSRYFGFCFLSMGYVFGAG